MKTARFLSTSFVFAALGAHVATAVVAHARACTGNADCPKTYACNTGVCVAGPCEADGDCASGMVCSANATGRTCVPEYTLPCKTAATCGTGFDCKPSKECFTFEGTTHVAVAGPFNAQCPDIDGGVPQVVAQPGPISPTTTTCGCVTLATSYCEPTTTYCQHTTDCPSNWTCEPNGLVDRSLCGRLPLPDGGSEEQCPGPEVVVAYCQPPYFDLVAAPSAGVPPLGGATGGATSRAGAVAFGGNNGSGGTNMSGADTSNAPNGSCQMRPGRANGAAVLILAVLGLIGIVRRTSHEDIADRHS